MPNLTNEASIAAIALGAFGWCCGLSLYYLNEKRRLGRRIAALGFLVASSGILLEVDRGARTGLFSACHGGNPSRQVPQ